LIEASIPYLESIVGTTRTLIQQLSHILSAGKITWDPEPESEPEPSPVNRLEAIPSVSSSPYEYEE
jgi:hypothetical protein